MSSISGFLSVFKGGARPNRYRVTVPLIGGNLDLFCKAASFPGTNIGTCEVPYMGRIVKVAGDRTFDEWTITVINDIDFTERKDVCAWGARLNSHDGNVSSGPGTEFTDIHVQQMSRQGKDGPSATLHYAFPVSIGEITLGWDQNDQVEEYEITFAYNYWTGQGAEG